MKKNLKITVAISAFNEEKNIANALVSILKQEEMNFDILEILVISDGSTDNTTEKVKEINDDRIKLITFKERKGKSARLNLIFRLNKGDILVLFDADVLLVNSQTLAHLIKPFLSSKSLGLVGGNPQPIKGRTFIEEAVNVTFQAYAPLRNLLRKGRNPYGCDGRILALTKQFVNLARIPCDMITNDAFLYFLCIDKGFKFQHVSKACVWYRSPTSISDQIKQNKRFIAARYRLESLFGGVVRNEYKIPLILKLKLFISQIIRRPIHCFVIFLINLYCFYLAKKDYKIMSALWFMAKTTKEDINYD